MEPSVPTDVQSQIENQSQEIQELRAEIKKMSRYTGVLEKIMGGEKKLSSEEEAVVMNRILSILVKMTPKKEPEKPSL